MVYYQQIKITLKFFSKKRPFRLSFFRAKKSEYQNV